MLGSIVFFTRTDFLLGGKLVHSNSFLFPAVFFFTTFIERDVVRMLSCGIFSTRDSRNHFSDKSTPTFSAYKIVKFYPRHLKFRNITF